MTDTELQRIKAICDVARVKDIEELSDGFHTFKGLYEQRLVLFAALVKAYKDKAWKSYRHEDGEWCFGGGWFVVGIDTPEGTYTYHYENKYWKMFDCVDLPRAPHWDGHTEADAETRLMSLEPEQKWIQCSERLPEEDYCTGRVIQHSENVLVTIVNHANDDDVFVDMACTVDGKWQLMHSIDDDPDIPKWCEVIAWQPMPEPWKGET